MNGLFRSLILQFREFYKNLTPTKRMSMLFATGIVFVSGLFMIVMVSGTDYVPLLTNIPSDQTALIVDKLQQKNVPFKVQDGGKTIVIPKDLLHSTQMALMSEIGSSKTGSVGLELFDKQDFGSTSYAQRINYQRALQGELMRAINTLDAVERSKVMLALPAKKTFLEEGKPPTASVVVELHPGKVLSEEQVRGITFLVANAVEGLDADKVSVVDSRGKVLSRTGSSESQGSNELADMQAKKERELEERVEAILARVVGQGKVMARVNAQLVNRHVLTTEETVDPEKTALLSTQTEEETLNGSRTNPTGVPGARANLPGAAEAGTVGFNQDVKKELKTSNYAVPKTVRNIKEAAGGLERVTVAVVVDGTFTMKTNDKGEEVEEYVPRNPQELAQFETIVKNAIGFNETRGDSVKIENIRFTKEDFSESEKMMTTLERKKLMNALLKWVLLGLALAMFFFIVIRPFMRWVTDSFQDSVEDMLPRTIEELEELQSVDNTLPGMSSALPVLEESLDPDKAESELLKERIMTLMEKDEEKAAGAFSLWLVRKDGA
ncbi:MAG TPA: flagellar basal-body MS-ring/collar protein FliF [Bdellovibrionales bacterium]|nr:flagellar basal-body MS-ring/collar protein FliF [Bdellovibrionales bacterium]